MDMKDIAAGKYAWDAGHKCVIHRGPVRPGLHHYLRAPCQLILRYKADGQEEGVAFHMSFGSADRPPVRLYLSHCDSCKPVLAVYIDHRCAQIQRDPIIIKTLLYIPGKSARVGEDLKYRLDPGALKRHSPGHDHAYIA